MIWGEELLVKNDWTWDLRDSFFGGSFYPIQSFAHAEEVTRAQKLVKDSLRSLIDWQTQEMELKLLRQRRGRGRERSW